MVISHNVAALNTQRQFGINEKNKIKSSEKLASGYKINRASDDAAGLAISEKMRKQIRGLKQGVENTQAGISLCQVADGALAEVHDMLQRISELSVQAANGINSYSDRKSIQGEINQLLTEIDRIGETTTFNDKKIFQGEVHSRIVNEMPEVLNSSYQGSKQDYIRDYTTVMVDGSDLTLTANKNNSVVLTKDNINMYATETVANVFELQAGTYQIDASIKDVVLKLTGNVTIHDSNLDNVSLACKDCNLTIENVSMKVDAYTPYTWQGIYFSDSDNSLTFIGENKIEVDSGEIAAINVVDSNLEIYGNGTLDIVAQGENAHGIAAATQRVNFGNITINSGNINIQTVDNVNGKNHSVGLGNFNRNLQAISDLTINGGNINIQAFSDGSPAIAVRNFTINGGSVLASAAEYNRNGYTVDYEKNGQAIIADNFKQTGGAILAIGGNGLDSQGSAMLIDNNPDIGRDTFTNDGRYYYLSVAETYIQNYNKNEYYTTKSNIWIQSGCDTGDGIMLDIDGMDTSLLGIKELDVLTEYGADKAMTAVEKALVRLSANRSKIGAQQNRLEHTIDNENNIIENTTSAESRIRDTDMAELMVKYSKENILEQVGQTMMAQANQSMQSVMSLLQ